MSSLDQTPAISGCPQGVRATELAAPPAADFVGGACADTETDVRADTRRAISVVISSRPVIVALHTAFFVAVDNQDPVVLIFWHR
jgi:hypothetical protein